MRAARFDREIRDANAHVRAGRVQSEADHQAQVRDLSAWLTTLQRAEPCACGCGGWPFPNAPYHMAPEGA